MTNFTTWTLLPAAAPILMYKALHIADRGRHGEQCAHGRAPRQMSRDCRACPTELRVDVKRDHQVAADSLPAGFLDMPAKVGSQPILVELAGHGDPQGIRRDPDGLPPNHISNRSVPTLSANANSTADTISVSSLVTSCVPRPHRPHLRKSRL